MFIETEITDKWDALFPIKLADEIEKQGYTQSGNDGVFMLPNKVSNSQCYRDLVNSGYRWNKEVFKGFKKEYSNFKPFYPQ